MVLNFLPVFADMSIFSLSPPERSRCCVLQFLMLLVMGSVAGVSVWWSWNSLSSLERLEFNLDRFEDLYDQVARPDLAVEAELQGG